MKDRYGSIWTNVSNEEVKCPYCKQKIIACYDRMIDGDCGRIVLLKRRR